LNGKGKKTNFAAILGYWPLASGYWQLYDKGKFTFCQQAARSQEPEASCKFLNLKSLNIKS